MILILQMALTSLVIAAVKVEYVDGKCRFPDYLQRNNPWAGDYRDGPLVAYIKPNFIMIRESFNGGVAHTFRKDCVKRAPDNKFLVRLDEDGHPSQYQCIQFLKRSEDIIQIKTSDRFDRQSMEICKEEGMRIDPFPLVQMKNVNNSNTCPFVGGYNFLAYYPRPNNSLVCGNNLLLMRVESECERGEGIEFDFRQEHCVPKGLPRRPVQKAYCVAHWTQEAYTFIILQHAHQKDTYWCMRTSDPLTHISTAYLWTQFVCDSSLQPSPDISMNYLKLQFSKRVFSSTCTDELQICQGAEHYCDINYKKHCALTCGECLSEDQIGMCPFGEQFRGQWMDSGLTGDYIIDVKSYSIRSQNVGNYDCLNIDSDYLPHKRVLLEIYNNGCLPRYACAEMSKVNSSVMKFRLGRRHPWPLPSVKSIKEYLCKAENFLMNKGDESRHQRQRPPRLLVNTKDIKEVHCGLPPRLQHGIAFLEDGLQCGGCLYYDPEESVSRFIVRPINCKDESDPPASSPASQEAPSSLRMMPIEYNCLASFQFYNGSYSVITKTASFNRGMGQYLVWIFTHLNQIKVMKASETFVYKHERHPKAEYVQAQFSILRNDNLKCRVNTYPNRPASTTSTTTTSSTILSINDHNHHWIGHTPQPNHHKTTPGTNRGVKGGKYTYLPSNDTPYNDYGDKVTPHTETSKQNLEGKDGSRSNRYSIVWLCVTFVASFLTCHLFLVT